ncbi:amino acid adenylation domain-containing protein [Streptomyces sp. NPDC056796]|uniref:amino acid adenylation domain-containing protein n=1 Tax=Streptomyces sp. NPDC056796 TaxID=3345947 RepID=UPI00369BD1B4
MPRDETVASTRGRGSHTTADYLTHRRFEERVRETPQATVLVYRGRTVSYDELDRRAESLAAALRDAGTGPEALVGIHLDRGPDAVTAVVATWKAGGAYVPLDPAQPHQRLAHILRDSEPTVIVTTSRLAPGLPSNQARVVLTDSPVAPVPGGRPRRSPVAVRPDNLAYVIYTSGSTGRPKGVGVAHRGLVTSYRGWEAVYDLKEGVRSHLQVAGFSFDVSTGDFARALLSGGTLVLCDREDLLRPDSLHRLITEHDVHMMDITPAVLRLLMDHLEQVGGTLERMRLITVGGEAWPRQDYLRLRRLVGPRTKVFCSYGVTESSVDSTCFETTVQSRPAGPTLPIGHAFPGTWTTVVDPGLIDAGQGEEGELYLSGAGLARGYHGRPALTALRFVPAEGGQRRYRTGDRARFLPDGAVEHLGRIDDEIKLNGVRVQPAEIETALRSHAGVGHAVTSTRRGEAGIRLHAYVTPAGPTPITAEELRRHAALVLPTAMVPTTFTVLDRLPLNANGKVDRHRLPEPLAAEEPVVYEAPKGNTEFRIAGIWQRILGLPRVGALDDFLSAGGDSLTSARVCAQIRSEFGVDILPSAALTHPTVRELAALVELLVPETDPPTAFATSDGRYPLSPTQRRLWLLNLINGPDATYNIPLAFSVEGALDHEALRTAVNRVVSRHAPLRTRIATRDGAPVQEVLPHLDVPLAEFDLRGESEPESRALEVMDEEVRRPFDLTNAPLIRVAVLRVGEQRHHVLVTVHHIVFDGWSAEILLREIGQDYSAAGRGELPVLSPPTLSYGDIAAWQDRRYRAGEQAGQLDYWMKKFRTPPPSLDALADRPRRSSATPAEAGRVTHFLSPGVTAAVRACGQAHSSTLFVTLLSGFMVLLGRLAGEHDITIGTPISGRDREETQDLVGFFINTVAIRADLGGAPAFTEVLHQVRDTVLEAHSHQDLPFEDVVAGVSVAREVGRNPLFQTWFNLLGDPDQPPHMSGLSTRITELPAHAALFDLGLYVTDHGGRLRLDLAYDRGMFSRVRAQVILEQLAWLLEEATAQPRRPVGEISLVTRSHQDVLPNPAAVLRAEERPALSGRVRTGMAAARVHDSSGVLDGASLGTSAARVARALARRGLRPGDVVAVYAARSATLVSLIVGILESGAAFLVLDPAHPPARLVAQTAAVGPALLVHCEEAGPLPVDLLVPGAQRTTASMLLRAPCCPGSDLSSASEPAGPSYEGLLAYVMFTSGSTGPLPRGVLGGPAPLEHFLDWYTSAFGLGSDNRFALLSGLGHDPLLRDVLTPLWVGGELHVPDSALLRNPASLLRWLAQHRITVLHLTPPLARLLAIASADTGVRLPDVRLVCYGGDVLRRPDVASFAVVAPSARHVNFYGATETPQAMAYHEVKPGETDAGEEAGPSVPIGTGIDDVQLLVLADTGELCGVGEVGAITVRTPYLAHGYLPPAGEGGFHEDPVPGVRRFATGDRGRFLPDGSIEILGRADRQLKIRGFRVDTAEIEAVCGRVPGVNAAAVLARSHPGAETRLTAYVVLAKDSGVTPDHVRAALEAALPAYMIPSELMEISTMPLTPNGKLDSRSLPDPASAPTAEDHSTEHAELEEAIRAIWSEVLGTGAAGVSIGFGDNFFDLGGTSQMMVRVQVRLREHLGNDIPLVSLFRYANIAALARHLRGDDAQESDATVRRRATRRDSAAARAQRLARRAGRS